MNYRGSYRHLSRNSRAALLAAIEIYNKPRVEYRDEVFCILLLNAWELLLKSILSKNRVNIFYPKRRNQPYRTLSCQDAFDAARGFFPGTVDAVVVRRNLDLLITHRDNAVHFYNEDGLSAVLWALAQTSIVSYRDILEGSIGANLAEEVNWKILPLSPRAIIDPIDYLTTTSKAPEGASRAARQFVAEVISASRELQTAGRDTARLLTVFDVKLSSVRKVGDADIVIGIVKGEAAKGPLAIERTVDPNISHPLRQKEVLERIPTLHGARFTAHGFQAIVWKRGLRESRQYCWRDSRGAVTKYSNDIVPFINSLTPADLLACVTDYNARSRSQTGPPTSPAAAPA